MRHIKKVVLSLALVTLTAQGHSAISTALENDFRDAIWSIRAEFHMYTAREGDPRQLEILEDAIYRGADLVAELEAAAESEVELQVASEVAALWPEYENLANSNTIEELGYTDRYVIEDLETAGNGLREALDLLPASAGSPGLDLAELKVLIRKVTSEYMMVSSSPDGGNSLFMADPLDFTVLVPEIDQKLDALLSAYSDNQHVMLNLKQVKSQWRFVRDSLIDFNENSIIFLVSRYARSMGELLTMAQEAVAPEVPAEGE